MPRLWTPGERAFLLLLVAGHVVAWNRQRDKHFSDVSTHSLSSRRQSLHLPLSVCRLRSSNQCSFTLSSPTCADRAWCRIWACMLQPLGGERGGAGQGGVGGLCLLRALCPPAGVPRRGAPPGHTCMHSKPGSQRLPLPSAVAARPARAPCPPDHRRCPAGDSEFEAPQAAEAVSIPRTAGGSSVDARHQLAAGG